MLILFLWASMHGIAMMASSHTKLQALALRERFLCPTMSASMLLGSHQLCCPCTEMRRNVNLGCVASCLTFQMHCLLPLINDVNKAVVTHRKRGCSQLCHRTAPSVPHLCRGATGVRTVKARIVKRQEACKP